MSHFFLLVIALCFLWSGRGDAQSTCVSNCIQWSQIAAIPNGSINYAKLDAATIPATASGIVTNVKDSPYNATGNGTTDDTAAIIAAIAAGSSIYFPPGTYVISDGAVIDNVALAIGSNKHLWGAGVGVSTLRLANAANAHMVNIAASSTNVTIDNLSFDGNSANQTVTVHGIRSTSVSGLRISQVHLLNIRHYGIGLQANSAGEEVRRAFLSNISIENPGADGIDIKNANTTNQEIFLNNITVRNPGAVTGTGSAAIDIRGVAELSNIQVLSLASDNDGIRFRHTTLGGQNSSLTNFYVSSSSGLNFGVNVAQERVIVSNGVLLSAGVLVQGAVPDYAEEVVLSNLVVEGGQGGIRAGTGSRRVSIIGCASTGITGATGDAFRIEGNQTTILGGYARTSDRYGVHILAGTTDTTIIGLTVESNVTAQITDSGTATQIVNTRGYVVQNAGTATVANGTTSIAVTHGLSFTPTLQQISVTPTNNKGTAAEFWISTPTATQFTINVDADPGATTATFVWRARRD